MSRIYVYSNLKAKIKKKLLIDFSPDPTSNIDKSKEQCIHFTINLIAGLYNDSLSLYYADFILARKDKEFIVEDDKRSTFCTRNKRSTGYLLSLPNTFAS